MYDYEYLLVAIDEVLCHNVAAIICMENYKNCYLPKGFKKIFDLFCEFIDEHESHKKNTSQTEDELKLAMIKFQSECHIKQEDILKLFIKELKGIDSNIDYEKEVEKYIEDLAQQDVQSPEMQLLIYPYLISLIREREERL